MWVIEFAVGILHSVLNSPVQKVVALFNGEKQMKLSLNFEVNKEKEIILIVATYDSFSDLF